MYKIILIPATLLFTFFTIAVCAQNLFLTPQPKPQTNVDSASIPPPPSATDFANQINAENSQNNNQSPFLNELQNKLKQAPSIQPLPNEPPKSESSSNHLVIPAPATPTSPSHSAPTAPPPMSASPNQTPSPSQGVAPRIPPPPAAPSTTPSTPPPPARSDVYTGFSSPSGTGSSSSAPSKSDNWNINY